MARIDADIWQDLDYASWLEVAKMAENNGFEAFWLIDSTDAYDDYCAWDSLVAVNTSRIKIGPNVTNPLTRHPRVTANHMLTLHEISKGRAVLGIGAGANAVGSIGWKPASAAVMREAVKVIREKFRERKADIPIHVAAVGPLNTRMALQLADGIIFGGSGAGRGRDPGENALAGLELLKAKAKEVGRDFNTLEVSLGVSFAISHNRKEAIEEIKGPLAGGLREGRSLPPGLERFQEEAQRVGKAYDWFDHMRSHSRNGQLAQHAKLMSDELAEALSGGMAGTPEEVFPRMKSIWQAVSPIHNVTLAFRPRGVKERRKRSFELLVKEILPKLRS